LYYVCEWIPIKYKLILWPTYYSQNYASSVTTSDNINFAKISFHRFTCTWAKHACTVDLCIFQACMAKLPKLTIMHTKFLKFKIENHHYN